VDHPAAGEAAGREDDRPAGLERAEAGEVVGHGLALDPADRGRHARSVDLVHDQVAVLTADDRVDRDLGDVPQVDLEEAAHDLVLAREHASVVPAGVF